MNIENDLYTKHKPKFVKSFDVKNNKYYTHYLKSEINDDFLFKKTMSISINAKCLVRSDYIVIKIIHRNVEVKASCKEIKEFKDVKTFKGEIKFYYPVEKWEIVWGDIFWLNGLRGDYERSI